MRDKPTRTNRGWTTTDGLSLQLIPTRVWTNTSDDLASPRNQHLQQKLTTFPPFSHTKASLRLPVDIFTGTTKIYKSTELTQKMKLKKTTKYLTSFIPPSIPMVDYDLLPAWKKKTANTNHHHCIQFFTAAALCST